jgi:hypothetical protein
MTDAADSAKLLTVDSVSVYCSLFQESDYSNPSCNKAEWDPVPTPVHVLPSKNSTRCSSLELLEAETRPINSVYKNQTDPVSCS